MSEQMEPDRHALHRSIAAQCNNAAWNLIEKPELNADECVELVRLAATASYHWNEVGTSQNIASADMLYGWALARAGAGPAAVNATQRAFDHYESHPESNFDMACTHAAMAAAALSNGDTEGHREHYATAEKHMLLVSSDDLGYLMPSFRTIPKP